MGVNKLTKKLEKAQAQNYHEMTVMPAHDEMHTIKFQTVCKHTN